MGGICKPAPSILQLEDGEPDFLGPAMPSDIAQAIAAGELPSLVAQFSLFVSCKSESIMQVMLIRLPSCLLASVPVHAHLFCPRRLPVIL
jgi:hypothetical protein